MKKKQTKKSGFVKRWIVVVVIILASFAGYKYVSAKKQMGQRRAASETQRQVMIEFWEGQGLSDEEIQLKLNDLRQERIDNGERSPRAGIIRMLGGGGSPRK
jgi:predicted negative regulator of RcsB-dependent stress response